jgi:hypothetical protein
MVQKPGYARQREKRGGHDKGKVAGISTSNIKAKELDGPLAGHASVVGGAVPMAGALAAGRFSTRAAGSVARAVSVFVLVEWLTTVGISINKWGSGITRVGAKEEAVI